ncbi:hypothetical protein CRE_21150 [Caenorhabditis remanei]|uniref:Uncharacterized protein n=1 Tax=Caenorhabditis remanei TaxID=31234 RepID=E3MF02_CAERE|nr:hypothetical protein CRE_21150 [Caenorhabditis remanei]
MICLNEEQRADPRYLVGFLSLVLIICGITMTSAFVINRVFFQSKYESSLPPLPFDYEEFQQEKERMIAEAKLEHARIATDPKLQEARKTLLKNFETLPKSLWDKFKPDLTRFQGYQEYLAKFPNTTGTYFELYLYGSPRLERIDNNLKQVKIVYETRGDYYTPACTLFAVMLNGGDLYFNCNYDGVNATFVYYIPAKFVMNLVK